MRSDPSRRAEQEERFQSESECSSPSALVSFQYSHSPERDPFALFVFLSDWDNQPVAAVTTLRSPSTHVVLLRKDHVDGLIHAAVFHTEFGQDIQNLQCIGLIHQREAEPKPSWLGNSTQVMAAFVDVVNQQELGCLLYRIGYFTGRSHLFRYGAERFQR